MRERLFFNDLKEELKRRGFFIVTDYAPFECIHLFGIRSFDDNEKYAEELRRDYRIAAVKNIEFCVGGESARGWYEVLAGSQTKEPFPMIYINLMHNGKRCKMAFACDYMMMLCSGRVEDSVRYITECLSFVTQKMMLVVKEWITEGEFPDKMFEEVME